MPAVLLFGCRTAIARDLRVSARFRAKDGQLLDHGVKEFVLLIDFGVPGWIDHFFSCWPMCYFN
jgi:hypothetical protein